MGRGTKIGRKPLLYKIVCSS